MSTGKREGLALTAMDVSGQKRAQMQAVPPDSTIGELIDVLLLEMGLPPNDSSGRPLTYQALLEREGRHLLASEQVGTVLQNQDQLTLHPNVDAGAA